MMPIVNGLEEDFGDQIAFQRLNVDEPEGKMAAREYKVRGHPTMVLIDRSGEVVSRHVGVLPREFLVQAIENTLE